MNRYDCAIVGGGIAGLQAALQLGRYKRSVLVIDAGEGRSNLCLCYHNLLGWPDGVSGDELRRLGRLQAERLGVAFVRAKIVKATEAPYGIRLEDADGGQYEAKLLLLATGVKDRIPDWERYRPYLGVSLFICPDCDGYGASGRRTLVLGSGNPGASMAQTLRYWTDDIVYINTDNGEIGEEMQESMRRLGVECIDGPVSSIVGKDGQLQAVETEEGRRIEADYGFVAFGGNNVRSELAVQLGIELAANRHIVVEARTKRTSHRRVWAAGDVTPHSEQASIAIGDGSQAAIWMHKTLLEDDAAPPRGSAAREV